MRRNVAKNDGLHALILPQFSLAKPRSENRVDYFVRKNEQQFNRAHSNLSKIVD